MPTITETSVFIRISGWLVKPIAWSSVFRTPLSRRMIIHE